VQIVALVGSPTGDVLAVSVLEIDSYLDGCRDADA
jgi:hypothetical protein